MTPPEPDPLPMTPPVSPVETSQPPSSEAGGGSLAAQGTSSNVPAALLPEREPSQQSHREESATKVPRVEVPETRTPTRGADEGESPTKIPG